MFNFIAMADQGRYLKTAEFQPAFDKGYSARKWLYENGVKNAAEKQTPNYWCAQGSLEDDDNRVYSVSLADNGYLYVRLL